MTRSLLWHSNSPFVGTGYGAQTALFAPMLADRFNLGISAFYGLEGAPVRFGKVPVYPGVGQTHGNETITEHARVHFDGDVRDGLVVTLMDVWVLDPRVWAGLNVASWVPVDHEPCPPRVAGFFQHSHAIPVAMSRFGERMLRDAGLDPVYVPHGVDTKLFRPVDRRAARERTKMPQDAFVCGMVAANKGNPSRKAFVENLAAFARFREQHDDAILYLHTELTGRFGGIDLPRLIDFLKIPREAVIFCDQYRAVHYPFPPDTLAHIYSSLDVLMASSYGEGFGIPTVESQACGTPVIVSDFSASAELCGAGWKTDGYPLYTPLDAYQFKPDVDDIHEALRHCYSTGGHAGLKAEARQFALQYDAGRVLEEFMLPALDECFERVGRRAPVELVA